MWLVFTDPTTVSRYAVERLGPSITFFIVNPAPKPPLGTGLTFSVVAIANVFVSSCGYTHVLAAVLACAEAATSTNAAAMNVFLMGSSFVESNLKTD
jgi:hypothetical protein